MAASWDAGAARRCTVASGRDRARRDTPAPAGAGSAVLSTALLSRVLLAWRLLQPVIGTSAAPGATMDAQPDRAAAATGPEQRGVPTWDEIVERHSDRVYRLAYRLTGNRHDAEDLTQEVFVRVFRSLSTYTPGTFEGWLHRITTNLFLDQARRKQRIRFDALSDERADRLTSALAEPRRGLRRPHLRRRHRARPGHPAARLPRRGRALRRRGPDLRGDRRDPRRQARHRPLAHPPRPRHAAHALAHRAPAAGRVRYSGPATGAGAAVPPGGPR